MYINVLSFWKFSYKLVHMSWYVSHIKIKKNIVLFVKILGKRAILQMLVFLFYSNMLLLSRLVILVCIVWGFFSRNGKCCKFKDHCTFRLAKEKLLIQTCNNTLPFPEKNGRSKRNVHWNEHIRNKKHVTEIFPFSEEIYNEILHTRAGIS